MSTKTDIPVMSIEKTVIVMQQQIHQLAEQMNAMHALLMEVAKEVMIVARKS
jgi:hypothetical protein